MRAYRPIADRRRQLVEAGLTIAEREGVAGVTVRRVAAEAGVSLGLVSYCFGSKEELTLAMATRIVEELAEHASDAAEAGDDEIGRAVGIGGVLRGVLAGMWTQIERTPGRQLLTYEITTRALREPGLGDVARRQYDVITTIAAEILDRAARTAGVRWTRELDEVAHLAVMALDGAALRWLVDNDSDAALARLGDVADLLSSLTAPA